MIFTGSNTTKGIFKANIWILICLLSQPGAVQVLRFDQCQSGWIQVMEGTKEDILLTCVTSNPSDDITWSISNTDQGIRKDLSTCVSTPNGCLIATKHQFNLTRPENNFSNLELLVPADRSFLYKQSFICSQNINTPTEVVCNVDLVYPPSVPLISRNDSQELPYLEGETAYLECSINSSGNPTADLLWSGHRESYIMINSQLATLQLKSLSWEDNQRNITCQAKNNYTEAKHLDIKTFTVLQVYYSPIIRFREGKDNQCVFSLDPWQCSIDNGQRLEIDCTAHSNPSPANITWRLNDTSGLIISTSANLTIIANSSAQKVTYICTVTTETTHSNDSRLPLSSMKELTIVIKGVMSDMEISTRSKSVPAIVGGTVGGLILMVMFAVIAFTFKNKRQVPRGIKSRKCTIGRLC